ncbi:MAG: hypothetical protein U0694_28990 [Anaerolineae bacterium]
MRIFVVSVLVLVLCACQPQQPTLVLPTQIDLNALSTATAAAAAAQTGTAQALMPPALPPTWTPAPVVSATPTLEVTRAADTTAADVTGMIYYIYNGDSVARVPADGSRGPELILLANAIQDLALSPDGTLLAYVAQGNGSAREVFVSNLDGTYSQQISCLGFSRVLSPTWSWDSAKLAFLGAQTSDGPMDVYSADLAGSNNCPAGNNQRQLTQLASQRMNHLTWNADGSVIYFDNYNIGAVNLNSGMVYDVTAARGFGADTYPIFNPHDHMLYFLRPVELDREGGQLFVQDLAQVVPGTEAPEPAGVFGFYANDMELGRDGEDVVLAGADGSVFILDLAMASPILVGDSLVSLPPQPTLSPDGEYVAFVALGAIAPQIYVTRRVGGSATVITNHTEGTVEDIAWAAG